MPEQWTARPQGPDMRIVQHSVMRGRKVCEIWFDGRFVATVSVFDFMATIAVYSRHINPIAADLGHRAATGRRKRGDDSAATQAAGGRSSS